MAILLLAGAAGLQSSCWFKKKTTKAEPPVITAPPSTRTPPLETPSVPPPPKIDAAQTTQPLPELTIETPVPKPPVKQKPDKPNRRAKRAPARQLPTSSATQQPAASEPESSEPPAVPALTQLLTPAEQQAYNQAIDVALKNAQGKLAVLQSRSLTEAQRATFERAAAFVKQAGETRSTDLVTAKALAERADVLAENLVQGTR